MSPFEAATGVRHGLWSRRDLPARDNVKTTPPSGSLKLLPSTHENRGESIWGWPAHSRLSRRTHNLLSTGMAGAHDPWIPKRVTVNNSVSISSAEPPNLWYALVIHMGGATLFTRRPALGIRLIFSAHSHPSHPILSLLRAREVLG